MRAASLVGILALVTAWSASAQDAPSEPAKQEKKICQTERMTGSRTRSTRICLTREEWDRLRHSTKHDIDDLQRNGNAIPRQQSGAGAAAGAG